MQVEEVETTNLEVVTAVSVSLADIVLALVAAYVKSYWRPGLVSAVVHFPVAASLLPVWLQVVIAVTLTGDAMHSSVAIAGHYFPPAAGWTQRGYQLLLLSACLG